MDSCTIDFNPSAFPPEVHDSIPDDFIRIASYAMPNTTATNVSQQFSSFLILKLFSKKQTIPLINCKRGDVPRCGTCKAYLSPFVKVDKENRCWRCPLCGHLNSVIMFNSIYDMKVVFDRPELHSLAFDLQPPKEMLYLNGKHRVFLFMIDEWLLSSKTTSYQTMLKQLDDIGQVIRPTDLIGLIIYSSTVTIVNLREMKSQSFIEFEPEIFLNEKDFFVPASEGFENLKTSVKSFIHSREFYQTILYSAILWSCHLMHKIGGRLLIFSSGRNNYYGKDDNFANIEDFFVNEKNKEQKIDIFNILRNRSISVSLFKVGPLRQVEEWATKTGGLILPFGQSPGLLSLFVLETAWDAALSVRTSTNVQTVAVYGNGSTLKNGVYLFPLVKSDQSYIFELATKVPANVSNRAGRGDCFFFQFAVRFTDDEGLRKIRVINGMMPFTDVLRFPVDEAAISLFLLRKRFNESLEKVFNSRVELSKQLVMTDSPVKSQLPVLLYGGTILDSQFLNNVTVERFALAILRTKFVFENSSSGEKREFEVVWAHSMTICYPQPSEEERRVITDSALKLGIAPMSFFTPKDRPEFESMVDNEREAKRWYSEVTGFIQK
ncbi:hypothetical protein M9Y10_022403 [Tritrichomonas musculus]|uniref:Sec23/Sec24 trunk domain containing protein n=1 Tax=Tritrichomonas musculus TaxID=1915356 RepID=A0ABR2KT18_9EUKA